MLTYSSDSLPPIVCPMDEDAIPPNPFCSAPPPHSDPRAPLLPLSSSTPSSGNDGISGSRSSDRIQGLSGQTPDKQSHTGSAAAQKPSATKRERESDSMVRVSEYKQPRVESTRAQEKQNQDELHFNFGSDSLTNDEDQKSPLKEANICAAENVDEQSAGDTAPDFDAPESDTDTCEGSNAAAHAVENASAPKSWVIGPLFQSFKSKVASFTEIVMSPVKLFKANSPPRSVDHPDSGDQSEQRRAETVNGEHSEPSKIFEGQSENVSEDGESDQLSSLTQARLSGSGGEQNLKTDAFKHSPKLEFNVDSPTRGSEQADVHDSVPLQRRPPPCSTPGRDAELKASSPLSLQPYVNLSASYKSKMQIPSEMEEEESEMIAECPQVKPLPRKRTANGSVLPKVSSKTFLSECDVNGRHVPDVNLVTMNIADSCNVKTQLLLSSAISYTHQEIVCFPDDDKKVKNGLFVRKSLRNSSKPGGVKDPSLNSQKLEWELNSDTNAAAGLGKAKRRLQLGSRSQDLVKRKRLPEDTESAGNAEVLNVASDSGLFRDRRPPRNEIVPKNPSIDSEIVLNPTGRRQAVSKRAKGKGGQQTLETASETASHAETESSTGSMLGSSREKSSEISEKNQSDSNAKKKTSSSCKRLNTKTSRREPDVNVDNDTNWEALTKQALEERSLVVLHPVEVKPHPSTTKTKTLNTKPRKRKLQKQAISTPELESTLVSTSSVVSVEPSGSTHSDLKPAQRARKARPRQPTKRQKKDCVGAAKSGPNDLHLAKESQAKEGKDKMSADPVYFEMTPFENVQEAAPLPSQVTGGVSAAGDVFHLNAEVGNHSGGVIPALEEESRERSVGIGASELRTDARRAQKKPRRVDKQRRKGRLFRPMNLVDEVKNSVTTDDAGLSLSSCGSSSSSSSLWRSLLRSYSCPEIPSLVRHDAHTCSPSLHSPQPSRVHAWHQSQAPHVTPVSQAHKSLRRARRHTVCSVEVAREIAPLCLRKEVYPSRRSTQHLSPKVALSPGTSFSALASCFLSSPLAFLSKKFESRAGGTVSRGHASSPVAASFSTSPSCSTWHLPRADAGATPAVNSSGNPLEFVTEMRLQAEEEDDAEDTSSSSQEFEDVGLREEKALSDSEIKVVQKHQERGKVSSIRIRKTLPKPQNNLTPMGLPRPIRLKKKEFSLEEIYTNKNFNKPPESRLETIFEMPLSRRNGSESCFGQRRVRRVLEFPELGEARKPKKPLVGVGKAGTSRPRRGGYQNPKEPPSISAQDVDSLLCAKLEQLDLWLACDRNS